MVPEYWKVINERLLNRFSLENLKIGTPEEFSGMEFDVVIVSTFRFSIDESMGGFSEDE